MNAIDKSTGEIVTVTDISQSFPGLPSRFVSRPTLTSVLGSLLTKDFEVVFLEGPPESGKTIALAEFAVAHSRRSVSLFLRSVTEFTYDPSQIRFELCNQINWHLFGKPLSADTSVNGEYFRDLANRLARKAHTDKQTYLFVVDGLADIPAQAASVRAQILQLLPIGVKQFKFLIAGSPSESGIDKMGKIRSRIQQITDFGFEEARELFQPTQLSSKQIQEVHRSCAGRVGRMASVLRLLESGEDVVTLLDRLPDIAPEIFEVEWLRVPTDNQNIVLALAFIAHTPEIATIANVASLIGITPKELKQLLEPFRFIKQDPHGNHLAYVSESFRKFASTRLRDKEKATLAVAIKHLSEKVDPGEAFQTMPGYLERSGDISALIAFVTTHTACDALRKSRSVALVSARLSQAAAVANKANRFDASLRYQFQAASLRSVLYRRRRKQQVSAALSTHGESTALELASAAASDEERISLLALVARLQRSKGLRVNPQTVQEIERLADTIRWSELKQQAFDIATEILPVSPELGLRILESSVDRVGDPNGADWAIAAAFFRAATRSEAPAYGRELMNAAWNASAASTQTSSFLTAAAMMTTADSPSELFLDVDRVSSTGDKVLLLRLWLQQKAARADAVVVARRLIDVVLGDADYSPNPAAFLGVARVITSATNCAEDIGELLRIIESQLPQLKAAGPYGHYVRLLAELALARSILGVPEPLQPLVTEAFELEQTLDPALRSSCFAWILNACARIEELNKKPDEWDLIGFAEAGVLNGVDEILLTLAEQGEALRGIVSPMMAIRSDLLFATISRVNIEDRRDYLLEECSKVLLDPDIARPSVEACIGLFDEILNRLSTEQAGQSVCMRMLEYICDKPDLPHAIRSDKMLPLLQRIVDPDSRALTASKCMVALKPISEAAQAVEAVEAILNSSLDSIQDLSQRIDTGFEVAATLSSVDPHLAKTHYANCQRLASSPLGIVAGCKITLIGLLRLACRSLAGLERSRAATELDWNRVRVAIAELPSKINQSELWAALALSVWGFSQQRARSAIEVELKPLLRGLLRDARTNYSELQWAIVSSAPALWVHHSNTIEEFLGCLGRQERDDAYDNVVDYLIDGRIPNEPWRSNDRRVMALPFESASDCVRALGQIRGDSTFCHGVEKLLSALRHKSSDGRINNYQRTELLRQLRVIADKILPNLQYGIRHDGFKILFESEVMSCEESSSIVSWTALITRSQRLPNVSDCIFVLAHLITVIPKKFTALRRQAFEFAEQLLIKIHFLEDRLDRSLLLAESASDWYPSDAKRLLKAMMEESLATDRPSVERRRMRTLDLMHRLDAEAATAMASVTDSDPIKAGIRDRLKERLDERAVSEFIRDPTDNSLKGNTDLSDVAEACYKELGSLNAMRTTLRTYSQNLELMARLHNTTVETVYPIIAFAIEATSIRYHSTDKGGEYLRPLFVAILESFDLTISAAAVTLGATGRSEQSSSETMVPDVEVIAPGEQERAFAVIQRWLTGSKSTYMKICDPYFRAKDLEVLRLLNLDLPRLEISILTSRQATRPEKGQGAFDEFEVAWRRIRGPEISQSCFVTAVGGKKSGMFGIHDRWILLDDVGVSLGTSLGSVGGERVHTLTRLDAQAKAKCETEVDAYLSMQEKYHGEERLVYESFTLLEE